MARTSDLIFPQPVFVPKIWGGRRLDTEFGYDLPAGPVGECWAISAHPHGDCVIDGGAYDGRRLSELWAEEPQLFGGTSGDRFPLLIKILDVDDYLSVQVHPDDAYAAEHEGGSLGKSECWYVLEADDDARIMIGQHAKDRDEFKGMVEERRWDELLNEITINAGDFFNIVPGTVHAVRGALILEVQQSSDVTYRVYDFERLQDDGTSRELHLAQALDVIDFKAETITTGAITVPEIDGVTHLMDCRYFGVDRMRVTAGFSVALALDKPFVCVSVCDGAGMVSVSGDAPRELRKGNHFIAPAGCTELSFTGETMLIVSYPA